MIFKLNLAIFTITATIAIDAFGASPVNNYDAMQNHSDEKASIVEAKSRYKIISGQSATVENITLTIKSISSKPKPTAEIVAALDSIDKSNIKAVDDSLTPLILITYIVEPDKWIIRTAAARALLSLHREIGIQLCEHIIKDKNAPLESRLLVGMYLIQEENLEGYSTLIEGLESTKSIEREFARGLLLRFRKFEGAAVPSTGKLIKTDEIEK